MPYDIGYKVVIHKKILLLLLLFSDMFLLFLDSSKILSWRMNFVQVHFSTYYRDDETSLKSVYVLYYIYCFMHDELNLCPWDEANLVMLYNHKVCFN